jgi:hypothetical protein
LTYRRYERCRVMERRLAVDEQAATGQLTDGDAAARQGRPRLERASVRSPATRWWIVGSAPVRVTIHHNRLTRPPQRFRLCKSMSTWARPSLDHRVCGSGAGEYLADLRRQRRGAGKWRERIGDGLLGVFPRLEDDDGHADVVDRLKPVRVDEAWRLGTMMIFSVMSRNVPTELSTVSFPALRVLSATTHRNCHN